ncbi:plasmid recombination protein, partial [Leuconostoc mesenteroides]
VHYDETTPHLHYAFVPVVFDDKKSRYKVSAKEVLTRHDLQTFHDDLDQHLKKVLPFYEQGILNNKTLPFENVAEIKKYNDQFNALKNELADVEDNIRAKQALLTITNQALREVDLAEKQIDDFKKDLSKNIFGKTVLKPDDLDRFKGVLATMKKATLQSQYETEGLKQTLGQVKAQLADVQEDYQKLKAAHQTLQADQREKQKMDYVMRDILKNDYGVDKLSHTDVAARYVLYKLDHEELTQNKKVAQSWLKTLTTARADPDTKIAPTRLDRGIEQVKALINRIIELTRDIFKGPSL